MKEALEQYVRRVKDYYQSCRDNEAATKAALVAPLFVILGYDLADPRECKPEYKADFGPGRSVKPVDWAFCVNDSLAFLVEAKSAGKGIGAYDEQLGDYYAKGQPEVMLGILTTGVQWRFFTDLACEHVMDKEPFLKWDILKDDPVPFELLAVLQRAEFKPELIKTFAKRQYRQSLLVTELARLLEPSSEFVRLAIQNFEDRNLTATVIEEWKPILVSAIREWAKQQMLTMALGRAIDTKDGGRLARPQPETSAPIAKATAQAPEAPRAPSGGLRDASAAARKAWDTRRERQATLKDLIDARVLKAPLPLKKTYKGIDLEAELQPSGAIRFEGEEFDNPSAAGGAAARQVTPEHGGADGWFFWRYQDRTGAWVPLNAARERYVAGGSE
jgi:hypothetical protein